MSGTDGDRYSFEPFTRHAFFTYVNRWIVERVVAPGRNVIVDLGCGPGAVSKLILERLGGTPGVRVIGVDPEEGALERARTAIASPRAEFLQGNAESLSRVVPRADAVVFLNAIHLVEDKAKVIREIRRVLGRDGVLGFNTTFFAGAYTEGTGGFWRRWIVRSIQWLKEQHVVVQHAHADRAAAMQWLSPEAYAQLCVDAGFAPPAVDLVPVEMTPESLKDIGRFSLFIRGAIPGVPLAQASEALQQGLARALDETRRACVPRNWLQCVATAV